ncbi:MULTISPECIES: hypothetical protein [Aequorivita]|uniref:Lipoprotein n=1 Tax=Aequorivita iocasae TaxID=2803865 RepID=A0ABX7DUR4_9FLAO|nr:MULTISPECIES: hypothetical protein [Aequorivita]QQX77886.1 hypothetical protein JK629_06390 [Aequorivita iocasae]UCA57385.1 hypothetical protein LDL78_06420 [Aequorivita sp. F7]
MKHLLFAIPLLFLGCKKISDKSQPPAELVVEESPPIINEKPELPEGALIAHFIGSQDSIYAFVKKVDLSTETTLIAFENEQLPEIVIPESIGAALHLLKLKNFPNDVLLVNAKLKDTNFNEYYVFVWNDSVWKQPVNRFAVHKSNMTDTLIPIMNNPNDSTQLLRYYSVFNMDRKSEKKFTWKLMSESVPIDK